MIKLSLCIPTYNRAKFLPDLLESISKQYNDSLEIVIVDNGSSDTTSTIVDDWQSKLPRIHYERFAVNQGPDRCFLRTVELAKGAFCWLLGDDDILEPGAISRILPLLHDSLSGITLQRAAYDCSLKQRWIEPSFLKQTTRYQEASSCLKDLFPLLGFLSAQVIHRNRWLSITRQEDLCPYYHAYCLVYIIGRMVQIDPSWLYLHEPCIGWRSGNDSFAKELGRSRRLALDITSYTTIIQGLSKQDPSLYKPLQHHVSSIHVKGHIRDLLCQYKEPFAMKTLKLSFIAYKSLPSFWIHVLPLLLCPRWLIHVLRKLHKQLKTI